LHTIARILTALKYLVEKGTFQAISSNRHGLRANREPDLDSTGRDLRSNVLNGLEARRAEAVAGGTGGSYRETGAEHGGTVVICGFRIGYLRVPLGQLLFMHQVAGVGMAKRNQDEHCPSRYPQQAQDLDSTSQSLAA
jgi:hypothetical protein